VATAVGLIGVLFHLLLRWRGRASERALVDKLAEAETRVFDLRAQLSAATTLQPESKPVRIWMDGAFDMMHYGHVNAFRQGRSMGTHLVVGVNDDASITRCKGTPPVLNNAERVTMVQGCKFVDEVVPNVPYVMTDEYIQWVIKEYRIDYVVHGDDPCIVDGRDVYESAQRLGKYRTIPRTEGVSTTEIVGRMLLLTTDHHEKQKRPVGAATVGEGNAGADAVGHKVTTCLSQTGASPSTATPAIPAVAPMGLVRESKFLTTSCMLRSFAAGCNAPPLGAKVVYVDGGWDMFHAGHVDFLKRARELGDFLLVGVHNDVVVNRHRGQNYPILNLNERTLSVLSCRHVGDVVIDPPWYMTREMIAALQISVVAHGSTHDINPNEDRDPYEVPKVLGIFTQLESTVPLTVESIVDRIQENASQMKARVTKKMASEREYYDTRYGFATEPVT